MSLNPKSALALGSVLLTLTACASTGPTRAQIETASIKSQRSVSLATVPSDIRYCFKKLTGSPLPGEMSRAQVAELIGRLRASEYAKSSCGVRLLALYDKQAKGE